MDKKKIKLIAVILVAFAIRVIAFGKIPGGFNQDGVMAALDARSLAENGTDRLGMFMPVHFTAWGFGQMSVLMSYMMVPFIKLFGLNVVTARLPVLIASLAGLGAVYLLSRRTFSENVALVILAFAAINPWHIMQSRWALDCNMFPHIFLLGVLLLVCEKPCISMVFFALSMYCYGTSIYSVPLFLVLACIYLLRTEKIRVGKCLLCAAVYLLISWPFITCMIINALGLDTVSLPFCTIPYFPNSIRSGDVLFFAKEPLKQLWSNFLSALRIVFQISVDPLSNEIPGFGTMYLISWPFFIIGLVKLFRFRKKNTGTYLVFLWFVTAFISCLITGNVNINRANLIFYPMIIITGIGIYSSVRLIGSLRCPVIAAYVLAFSLFTYSYFTTYADTIKYVFLEDFGQALTYASSIDADRVYVTPNSQDKGRWYVSEVLAQYYCKDYSAEKFSFTDKESADVLVLDEPEDGAVQFGRFYVVIR